MRYAFKTTPYSHQLRALEKIRKLEGKALLALPMRCGKSKVAIDWASIAYHNHGLRRVLIVCPISVIDVWADEIQKHSPVSSVVTVLRDSAALNAQTIRDIDRITTLSAATMSHGIHWVIVNYEMVWRKVKEVGPRGGESVTTLDQVIARWQPDLVIADEAHKLKNPQSQQSKALMRLGAASRMRLALTGTPVTKAPLDLYGLFRFTDPDTFEQKKWVDFKNHFADWQPARFNPHVREVVRYTNLDELVARTRAHSFRVSLKDAFPDLPEKTYQNIRVPLPKAARRVYDEMAKEMITYLEGGQVATAEIVLEKLMRLSQITSGFVKDEQGVEVDVHSEKLDALLDLIFNVIEQDEKIVVFCRFKHDYHRISDALRTRGIFHVLLTGEQSDAGKAASVRSFREDSDIPVIICQTQSGSLGIDLSAARLLVFYSLDYNWATYVQAQDRILNVRDPRPLGIYHLVVPNSVDMAVLKVLEQRTDLAQALIHNPRMLLDERVSKP